MFALALRPRRPVLLGHLLLGLFLLAACDMPPRRESFAELTFQHLPPIRLDVAEVEVVEAYRNSTDPTRIEMDFPTPPGVGAARWGRDRLQAVGADGLARYTVLKASVVATPLPRTTGLTGTFTEDQSDRYDALVQVRLEVENRAGQQTGIITAEARDSATAAEDMTLNQRETLWFEMTQRLLDKLNAELEAQIGAHFGIFLR